MLDLDQSLYCVPEINGKPSMNFPTGFAGEKRDPLFGDLRRDKDLFIPAMMEAEKALPEEKRHTPQQLVGIAMGHIARAEGLWHVHMRFYERSAWEFKRSGTLDISQSRVAEIGPNQTLHWYVSSLSPAKFDGIDNDYASVGFAQKLHQEKGRADRYRALFGDTNHVFDQSYDMAMARIVTQYAGVREILKWGRQAPIFSCSDLTHAESRINSSLLTADGKLNVGATVPVASEKSPDLRSGFAYQITGPGEEIFPGMTRYDGQITYDGRMYNGQGKLVIKHRSGNEYQTPFVQIEEEGNFSLLPWCIEPLDMSDEKLKKMIAGVTLLTRASFNLQGFDSNANPFLGGLVQEDPELRAVVSYSAGGENGASNQTVSGLFKVFKETIDKLAHAGRLNNIVGEGKPFETVEALDYVIDHPEVWITKAQMHAPLETEFDIFTDPHDPRFDRLANFS